MTGNASVGTKTAAEMQTSIVVGVDFSSTGDLALLKAMLMARHMPGAALHIVHVVGESELFDMGVGERIEQQNAALVDLPPKVWDRVAEVGRGISDEDWALNATVHIRLGDAADSLHQAAVDYDATLIVIGTHGRRGLERLVLGSVAEKLVKNARCSVLTVKATYYSGLAKSPRIGPISTDESLATEKRESHVYSAQREVNWSHHAPTGYRIV